MDGPCDGRRARVHATREDDAPSRFRLPMTASKPVLRGRSGTGGCYPACAVACCLVPFGEVSHPPSGAEVLGNKV